MIKYASIENVEFVSVLDECENEYLVNLIGEFVINMSI
jgi:hypothetical protein